MIRKHLIALAALVASAAPAMAQPSAPAAIEVPSVAALQASAFGTYIHLQGRLIPGDGGDGYYYRNGSTCTPDDYSIIKDRVGNCFYRSTASGVIVISAVGNGVANDTAAVQAVFTNAPSGATVYCPATAAFYRITAQITITKPVTIAGSCTMKQMTAGQSLFRVTSSDVTFDGSDGLRLTGGAQTWPATYIDGENAITVTGTFNAGVAPTYISNITIRNLRIDNWGDYGIKALYINGLRVTNTQITNIVDGALSLFSTQNFDLSNNLIDTVTGLGAPGVEAYGIAITRETGDAGNLTSQPASCDGTVANNRVRNITTWNGIDTHTGCRIAFTGNDIYNVKRGYAIGASVSNLGGSNYYYPPVDISVTGGTIDSAVTDGSAFEAISFTGASFTGSKATGSISNVVTRGYGQQSSATSAAFVLAYTEGLTVSNNVLNYPGSAGISANTANTNLSLADNTVLSPWSNTAPVVGIRVTGSNNSTKISGNVIKQTDKVATELLTSASGAGIRLSTGTGNSSLISGGNKITATNTIVDVSGITTAQIVANGVTPVVVANTAVNDYSIITYTPVVGAVGKGLFTCAIVKGVSFSACGFAGDASTYNWQFQQ